MLLLLMVESTSKLLCLLFLRTGFSEIETIIADSNESFTLTVIHERQEMIGHHRSLCEERVSVWYMREYTRDRCCVYDSSVVELSRVRDTGWGGGEFNSR